MVVGLTVAPPSGESRPHSKIDSGGSMEISRRRLARCAGAALVACSLSAVALGSAAKPVAYFAAGDGSSAAFLIDWQAKHRARVVTYQGTQQGGVASDGTQEIVSLDAPISALIDGFADDCGEIIQKRKDLTRLAVRNVEGGLSRMNEIGTYTNVGGCQDGLVTPFGSPDDEGSTLKRLAMASRPPVDDLVPGIRLVGFSEDPGDGDGFYAEDMVTLQAGGAALFRRSGHVLPAAFDADQWLVFTLPGGQQRAYTRVALDAKTGGETWLMADWVDGQAVRVEDKMLVKPLAGAGFGTVAAASRMWDSGMFIATRQPFFFYLYKNGTGERVRVDLDLGTESRTPITAWDFEGVTLVQHRILDDGAMSFDRSWVPLRNEGKVRWVMESEVLVRNGTSQVSIKPRVNYYLDTGKAVPPAAR
jgi:hypothetical protein